MMMTGMMNNPVIHFPISHFH